MAPLGPQPALEPAAPPRGGRRLLIAAGIVLAMSLLPWTCNANIGDKHWAWSHGGPMICGPIALVLAAMALVRGGRRQLRGLGAIALAVAALAAGLTTWGVLSAERVTSAPGGVDIDGAVRTVFEQMRDDRYAAIVAASEPEIQGHADDLQMIGQGFARALGRWQDVSDTTTTPHGDLMTEDGTARYERGPVTFQMSFRMHAGKPYLAAIHLEIPADHRPPTADAATAARRITDDMMAGALDRVHADVDPRVALPASFDDLVTKLHGQLQPTATVELVSQQPCGNDQCVELRIHQNSSVERVRVTESDLFGVWLAFAVTLGDG
jgi:hypothetical protein